MKPIVLLGEALGTEEARLGVSFCSSGGLDLLKQLDEAGVITLTACDRDYIRQFWTTGDLNQLDVVWRLHPEVQRLNVFNLHPFANDIANLCGPRTSAIPGYPPLLKGSQGYVREEFLPHLDNLAEALNHYDPNVVVALGNTALWSLTGLTGVSKFRGTTLMSTHTVADFKVLSTYHPAAVLRQYEIRPFAIIDLAKVGRESTSSLLQHTERTIWIEPSISDIERFYHDHIRGCDLLSVDIETAGNQVTCIGFAPSISLALVIPFYDGRRKNHSYWDSLADERIAWGLIRDILRDPGIPKLFQNGLYDITFLLRSMNLKTYGAAHDTMLLHHALQPEAKKDLGTLGSLYASEGAWKIEHRQRGTNKRDQ